MNTNIWQIQEAKNNLSVVVARACTDGVQTITKHGKPVAVVVAIDEFQNLKRRSVKKKRPLLEVLRRCPAPEIFTQLEQQRNNPDFGRTITLDE